jgi:hypothetical protein
MVTSGDAEHSHTFSEASGHVLCIQSWKVLLRTLKAQRYGWVCLRSCSLDATLWVARYAYRCFMEAFTWADMLTTDAYRTTSPQSSAPTPNTASCCCTRSLGLKEWPCPTLGPSPRRLMGWWCSQGPHSQAPAGHSACQSCRTCLAASPIRLSKS